MALLLHLYACNSAAGQRACSFYRHRNALVVRFLPPQRRSTPAPRVRREKLQFENAQSGCHVIRNRFLHCSRSKTAHSAVRRRPAHRAGGKPRTRAELFLRPCVSIAAHWAQFPPPNGSSLSMSGRSDPPNENRRSCRTNRAETAPTNTCRPDQPHHPPLTSHTWGGDRSGPSRGDRSCYCNVAIRLTRRRIRHRRGGSCP